MANAQVTAPWSPDQVESLNAYQTRSTMHPFTGAAGGIFLATREGWVEYPGGPVVQTWAHDWMANWDWKKWGLSVDNFSA